MVGTAVALAAMLNGCAGLSGTYVVVDSIAREIDPDSLGEVDHEGRDPGPYDVSPVLEYVVLGDDLYDECAKRLRAAGFEPPHGRQPDGESTLWVRVNSDDDEDVVYLMEFDRGDTLAVLDDAMFSEETTDYTATRGGLIISISD